MANAKLIYDDTEVELPLIRGTEGEEALDVRRLRAETGLVTYDPGFANTGACKSSITFIDGEAGVLRYRGYSIEEVAAQLGFTDVCYLLVSGGLGTDEDRAAFRDRLTRHSLLHEDMKKFFEGYPPTAHPMAIMAGMVASLSTFYPQDEAELDKNVVRLLAKSGTLAAFAYKKSIGQPFVYPRNDLGFAANFLRMCFAVPAEDYEVSPVLERALDKLLILHADHEQNCSASTMRMVGSSGANIFASVSAALCALWGPLHGGANQQVVEMLERVRDEHGGDVEKYLARVKDKQVRLMGFGHRVYKSFDPRATILKEAADEVLGELGIDDPLLDLAKRVEEAALADDYFVERRLYPNVDFYSGVIYRALGIPKEMFTVMFALGRMPGWIAQWLESREDEDARIDRPRQIYVGARARHLTRS